MSGRDATLAWNTNPDNPTGYMIHFGTQPGIYSYQVDAASATSYRLAYPFANVVPAIFDWPQDGKWYFVVMAYNAQGSSPASNEVSKAIQPYRLVGGARMTRT